MKKALNIGLTSSHFTSFKDALKISEDDGFNFVILDLINDKKLTKEKDTDLFIQQTIMSTSLLRRSQNWSHKVVGCISKCIEQMSQNDVDVDDNIRMVAKRQFRKEVEWSKYLNLYSVMVKKIPPTKKDIVFFASILNQILNSVVGIDVWIKVEFNHWHRWNKVRSLCDYHKNLKVVVDATNVDFTKKENIGDFHLWFADPVIAFVISDTWFVKKDGDDDKIEVKNKLIIIKLLRKLNTLIINSSTAGKKTTSTDSNNNSKEIIPSRKEIVKKINEIYDKIDIPIHEFITSKWNDTLQIPLQPLQDNLDSKVYETFEEDPIKYKLYAKAIRKALQDKLKKKSDEKINIFVVGAGRGPLVNCAINMSKELKASVNIYAVEKNQNAIVILKNYSKTIWKDENITIINKDMRDVKLNVKCDIMVSELLGAFGDNELSPECLYGIQHILKEDGVSIPSDYVSYVALLSSSKFYESVKSLGNEKKNFETPYVVKVRKGCNLSDTKEVFRFDHPSKNTNTERFKEVKLTVKEDGLLHGLIGYFESKLYKDISMSINPPTKTPNIDNLSWFPLCFPLKNPIFVKKGQEVCVNFFRFKDKVKVWYEWCLTKPVITNIHNSFGSSHTLGL